MADGACVFQAYVLSKYVYEKTAVIYCNAMLIFCLLSELPTVKE